ncbi:hypothetical protein [Nannocystis punicea]|uniref:Uncharacterized protein n=1 Tax=Nannocystis punicea TaxID=2995304 RepID=A0ABY7HIE0_9BACT|nr:hypothetical protein [Nannocystis poenicansa]WAS98986.1 hypothetical protein O0S08_22885 [Nannocystis poenicansa]
MRRMTLTFLLTSLVACGETGDTTATTVTDSTAADTTTTTAATDATTSEPTTADEPTAGTDSASEADTSTGETTTSATTDATTAVDTTGEGTTTETTAVDTTGETTAVDTTGETTDTTGDTEGTSPLFIAIVDAYLFANCMPEIEPDPVQGTWYVEFDNTGNPNDTSVVLTAASLSLEDADPPMIEPIKVSPLESPPLAAGDYVSVEMAKLPGMAHSACDHCDEFYTLALEYDEAGVKHRVEEAVTISCSF